MKGNYRIKDLQDEFIAIRTKMRLCNDVEEMTKLIAQYKALKEKLDSYARGH